MILRRLPLTAVVAAGAVAAGCGAADHRAAAVAQVQHTVRTALGDLAAGNARALCALATPRERDRLARDLARPSCRQAMRTVSAGLSPLRRRALSHARVRDVRLDGDTATVAAADISWPGERPKPFLDDDGAPTRLARQPDGRWLISG